MFTRGYPLLEITGLAGLYDSVITVTQVIDLDLRFETSDVWWYEKVDRPL